MSDNIPRFQAAAPLVESGGRPTQTFHIWWDTVAKNIEGQFTDINGVLADIQQLQTDLAATVADLAAAVVDIQTAQAAADAAAADAATAQADALEAAREAARINSYMSPGAGVLSAADAGTDASITVANHTRVYPVEGSLDVPDVSITGATLTGLSYSTRYYIYYDDTTLSVTAPTFNATTSSATAQVGAASGRHFVGYITTPASGGGGTTGDGGGPPGGGGGGGGGGGVIP